MNVDQHLGKFNDALVHHYARRRAERTPSVSARIKEPTRTVELGCFLRYCLLTATDQLILMFQRRVADLWRHCTEGSAGTLDWKQKYQELLAELAGLLGGDVVLDAQLRARLEALLSTRWSSVP